MILANFARFYERQTHTNRFIKSSNMRKTSLNLLILSASLLMGCEEYNMGLSIEDITYRHAFNEAFGDIDPLHTWNTAAQRSLDFHINVPGTFYLRVFTTEPRVASAESELLAYYKNDGKGYKGSTGESYSINFDCPSGLKKVFADIEYVDDGRHIMLPVNFDENGHGVVEFGKMVATRGEMHVAESKGSGRAEYIYKDAKEMHFTRAAYDGSQGGFLDLIPENVENTNKEHVSVDFSYVSTGAPLHLYPMYTWTGANVTIGLQYKESHSISWPTDINEADEKIWTTENSATGRITRHFTNGTTDGGRSNYYWCTDYTTDGFDYTICPGITIDLPAGYEFRFWVKQGGFIRYSNTKYNPDKLHYFGTFNNGHKHEEYGNTSDVLYLGVEDWNNSRHDINDIVMAFVGELPLVIEAATMIYEEAEYTIAYEDMGAIGDFDFNDVVFSVRHVSGATKAEVDLRAVGGTLPVYLKYDSKDLFGGEELHKVLGEKQEPKITDLSPINVGFDGKNVNSNGKIVDRTNMYFAEEEEDVTIPTGSSIVSEASKFSLIVKREDGTYSEIKAPDPDKKDKKNANIPQAIIVAKHNWDWPTENTRIDAAYSDFTAWVGNRNDSEDWFSPIWSGEDEHSTFIDYGVTLMPSYAYEKCLLNRDDINLKEEEAGAGEAYELVIPKSDLVITHYNEDGNAEVNHDLTTYPSFNLAFVVTGRTSGQTVTLKVYKNSVGGELIETLTFDDEHHNSTTSSSFGESLSQEVNIDWTDVNQIVVKVEEHPTNCHLNSIWTAMPEKDFHIMPLSKISTTVPEAGSTAKVALAFVASAQHVVDYSNNKNGWRSFSNYAVMLSQIETNGKTTNSPILYTLKRKEEAGHYMLLNPNGGYLKAPTADNQAHQWTTTESEAADLVIEACPNITLMQGCSSENAVSIKTTVNDQDYYFSANKPAMWRTSPTDHQKAIYLFHWGSH